jgi:hypothetical protein
MFNTRFDRAYWRVALALDFLCVLLVTAAC